MPAPKVVLAWAASVVVTVAAGCCALLPIYLTASADFGGPPALPVDDPAKLLVELTPTTAPACLVVLSHDQSLRDTDYCQDVCSQKAAGAPIGDKNARVYTDGPEGTSFPRTEIFWTRFQGRSMARAKFECARLHYVVFDNVLLDGADFTCAELTNVQIKGNKARFAILDHAFLQGGSIENVALHGAEFTCARLEGAALTQSDLDGAYLRATRIDGGTFQPSSMEKVVVAHARFPAGDPPKEIVALDLLDWRSVLVPAVQITETESALAASLADSAREFDETVSNLRGIVPQLEKQGDAATALSHRIEQFRLLWLKDSAEKGSIFSKIHYWAWMCWDFLTSNGTALSRLGLWLLFLWGASTLYFSLRFWGVIGPETNQIMIVIPPETEGGKEKPVPFQPKASVCAVWGAMIALGTVFSHILNFLGGKLTLPGTLTDALKEVARVRTKGFDHWVRGTAELLGWSFTLAWITLSLVTE